jgi:hypothetical protein
MEQARDTCIHSTAQSFRSKSGSLAMFAAILSGLIFPDTHQCLLVGLHLKLAPSV